MSNKPHTCSLQLSILAVIGLGFVASVAPQQLAAQTYNLRNVKVQLLSGEFLSGHLRKLTSDSLFVQMKNGIPRAVHYRSVDHVKMNDSDGVGNGALIGAGAGVAVGLVVGLAAENGGSTNGYSTGWQAMGMVGTTMMGALAGACIGAAIGSQPKKIRIGGDRSKYEEWRTRCMISFWKEAEKEKKEKGKPG